MGLVVAAVVATFVAIVVPAVVAPGAAAVGNLRSLVDGNVASLLSVADLLCCIGFFCMSLSARPRESFSCLTELLPLDSLIDFD